MYTLLWKGELKKVIKNVFLEIIISTRIKKGEHLFENKIFDCHFELIQLLP